MNREPVLVADCVSKRFRDRWVLHAASMRAVPGEVRALLGRNGVGKSTLMKIAAGLVAADSGTVHLRGRALLHPRLHRLASDGICFVPDHDLLSNAFTIREHLRFVASSENEAFDLAVETLSLHSLMDARPRQLSSGERRRAEAAFAWVRRPACLLADEPLRHIAPMDAELLLQVFRSMAQDGCAVVVTGHEVPALLAAAHHVTWCTSGTTYELGPPFMARNDERFMREFLGT